MGIGCGPARPSTTRAPVGGGASPSIVILDRSAFNRSCIAASLTSHDLTQVHAHEQVRAVPAHIACELALFFHRQGDDAAGLAAELRLATQRWPGVRTVVVVENAGAEVRSVAAKLNYLPSAIVADDIAAELLAAVLRLAGCGYTVLPRSVFDVLVDRASDPGGPVPATWDALSAERPLLATSTTRQREVMRLLLMGLSNKHIAQRLTISESTVKVHIRAIMSLLNVENRTQIVARLMCASSEGHG